MVFPFLPVFIDRGTGLTENAATTKVHILCSNLVRFLTNFRIDGEINRTFLRESSESVKHFKEEMKEMFDRHYETGLYTLKFYLLDHIMKGLERLETWIPWIHGHFNDWMGL